MDTRIKEDVRCTLINLADKLERLVLAKGHREFCPDLKFRGDTWAIMTAQAYWPEMLDEFLAGWEVKLEGACFCLIVK